MRTLVVLGLLACLHPPHLAAAKDTYHKVVAQKGDYIYALLRKYELDDHTCNLERFYEINQLERNAHLLEGESYYLPILVYDYNGKTIRSTIGISDWDLAVRIQKYNERMQEAELRTASYMDDRVLWVPYHILHCDEAQVSLPKPVPDQDETESLSGESRTFPIFGKAYENVPLASRKLQGRVYYVVSGHGGPDPGAMSRSGGHNLCEDEYAYDVSLRLCRYLVAHGATAYMVNRDDNDGIRSDKLLDCDTDEYLWGGVKMHRNQKPRLNQRSEIINQLYARNLNKGVPAEHQQLIIIHVDSRNKSQRVDLFFYHQPGRKDSRQLAVQLQQKMEEKYRKFQPARNYQGTVSARDLHMLRTCKPMAVYIELGNMQNRADQRRILLEGNREAVAKWLFEGLGKSNP